MVDADPVTGTGAGAVFTEQPTDEDLHAAAVTNLIMLMTTRWPGVDVEKLRTNAESIVALALEVGDSDAVVLIPDNRLDAWRLADAVRRTGAEGNYCVGCPNKPAPYDGQPAEQDLRAADVVIRQLLNR